MAAFERNLEVRSITAADAALVAALIRSAFAALEVELLPPPSALRVTPADIAQHLAAGGGGALHGEVGCVLWRVQDGGLYVSRLAVLPQARGQGVGRALLARAEMAARSMGLPRLHLEVRLALIGNRRLFRRAGFVEGAQHTHPGFDHPTYVAAVKELPP